MLTQLDGSPGCWGDRSGATGGPVYTAYAAHAAYTVYAAYAAYAVHAAPRTPCMPRTQCKPRTPRTPHTPRTPRTPRTPCTPRTPRTPWTGPPVDHDWGCNLSNFRRMSGSDSRKGLVPVKALFQVVLPYLTSGFCPFRPAGFRPYIRRMSGSDGPKGLVPV